MKLGIGIITYNDLPSLKRTINSIKGADYIYIVDGKFPGFKGNTELSDDGTREWVAHTGRKDIKYFECAEKEYRKRNFVLRCAEADNCDYVVMVDSDTTVIGDFGILKYEIKHQKIDTPIIYLHLHTHDVAGTRMTRAGWVFKPQCHYEYRHDYVTYEGELVTGMELEFTSNVMLVNTKEFRSDERQILNMQYKLGNLGKERKEWALNYKKHTKT